MLRKITKFTLAASLLVGLNTNAAIISGDQYTAGGKKVALQGLEWLSLDHTAGLSRLDIEDGFTDRFGNEWSATDWRYATRMETETLLGSLWGGVWAGETKGWQSSNYDGASWFINNFQGLEYDTGYGNTRTDKKHSMLNGYQNLDSSQFFFGAQYECHLWYDFTCFGAVEVADHHPSSNQAGNTGWFHEAYGLNVSGVENRNISTSNASSQPYRGSLLVRIMQTPVTVPESGSLGLLALGLFGVIARRRFIS